MTVRDIRNAIDGLPDSSPIILAIESDGDDCQPYIGLLAVGRDDDRLAIHLEVESGCECGEFDDMDDEDMDEDEDDDHDEDF